MIGRALFVVLLVSVQLGALGCTRQNPQPRARSEAGSRPTAKRVGASASRQSNHASPAGWTEPDPAQTPSPTASVRRTARAPEAQPAPPPWHDETIYPARTPDGREPLWRQRARNY